jgi:S-adenosylmethionine:tRNA ribosyltransferase-isomerase
VKTDEFAYELPRERIAQHPLPQRDASRLLVLRRATRTWEDRTFRELPAFLQPGALLVLNDTRVIAARLRAVRDKTGGQVEVLLLPPAPQPPARSGDAVRRRVLTRSGGHLLPGETLTLPDGRQAVLVERCGEAGDVLEFNMREDEFERFTRAHGETPLPPYIQRPAGPSNPQDRERYQTVFARAPGAVAAPTAGLHFTPELLARLKQSGVETVFLTLHVGPGTFRPVKAAEVQEHRMDPEPFALPAETARAVTAARRAGRRVVAVGTTVLRVLESQWDAEATELRPGSGLTDLYIYPPRAFHAADALLTNFHLPRSSLLMLAAAFAAPGTTDGILWLRDAYRHALESGYRFFSYGDACFFV